MDVTNSSAALIDALATIQNHTGLSTQMMWVLGDSCGMALLESVRQEATYSVLYC